MFTSFWKKDVHIRKLWALGLGVLVLYFFINFFLIGGESFSDFHTTFLPFFFLLLALREVVWILRKSTNSLTSRGIFRLMALGFFLWLLAEGMYFYYYNFASPDEIPYPSLADFAWVAGYFFIIPAFYKLYRSYGVQVKHVSANLRRFMWAALLIVWLLVIFYDAVPVLKNVTQQRSLEAFFTLAYPFLDGVLLTVVWIVGFTVGVGLLAPAWRIVILGLLVYFFSDFMFVYLNWYNLYYPAGAYTKISLFSDYLYVAAYWFIFIGFATYRVIFSSYSLLDEDLKQDTQATRPLQFFERVLVFLNADNKIIACSDSFAEMAGVASCDELRNRALADVLSPNIVKEILTRLRKDRMIVAWITSVKFSDGMHFNVRISAVAVTYDEMWQGANILMETLKPLGQRYQLDRDMQSVADYILRRVGVVQRERKNIIAAYFNQILQPVYEQITALYGNLVARSFLAKVIQPLQEQGVNIMYQNGRIVFPPDALDTDCAAMAQEMMKKMEIEALEFLDKQIFDTILYRVQENLSVEERAALREMGLLS